MIHFPAALTLAAINPRACAAVFRSCDRRGHRASGASTSRYNGTRLLAIPWEAGVEFTPAERQSVAKSLQIFQLGETAKAATFGAKRIAMRTNRRCRIPGALQLFIAEEHRHAALLGQVSTGGNSSFAAAMVEWRVPQVASSRGTRAGDCVLLTAELIATI